MSVVAVVGCAAGGLDQLGEQLVAPLVARGHEVPVTLTPAAASWFQADGTADALSDLTGFVVRAESRLPNEVSPHPEPDLVAAAPVTANSVAKLALGIADNQAMTLLCESLPIRPIVLFPRVNAAHTRHPAWERHLDTLAAAGVHLVYVGTPGRCTSRVRHRRTAGSRGQTFWLRSTVCWCSQWSRFGG